MFLSARPRTTLLFVKVVTADQALKLGLGSAAMSLWVIFFAIAVLVSLFGIHPPRHKHAYVHPSKDMRARPAKCTRMLSVTGLYCKISAFFELRKRRAVEFAAEVGDPYVNKHQKMYNEAVKTIRLAYANVLAGILEGKLHLLLLAPICCC